MGTFIILVFIGLVFFSVKTFAAVPTLQDVLAHTPQPVIDFFNRLETLNAGEGSDLISKNLPVIGGPISGFLHVVWEIILILLRGVGSIFVWVFHGIANALEGIILSS